ncbi:hypothetical protein FQN52_006002 [Onygenales sp. PD_12]|nr:hypothetical protein FQN52_006002 [Onygenales sp. PD_12]
MPIRLIWGLQRPLRERILVSCLMGMGLVATGTVCVKMTTFVTVGQGDPLSSTVWPSLLAKLEELLGIIAACTPCLKSPAERFLQRIGVISDRYANSTTRPSFVASHHQAPKDYTISPNQNRNNRGDDIDMEEVEITTKPQSKSSSITQISRLGSAGKSDWNNSLITTTVPPVPTNLDAQTSSNRSLSATNGNAPKGWEAI